MRKTLIAAACLAASLPCAASAPIVEYKWHSLPPTFDSVWEPGRTVEFAGLLRFDDAVVKSGHISSDVPTDDTTGNFYSYYGLESAYLRGAQINGQVASCSQFNLDNPDPDLQLNCGLLGEKVWGGFMGYFAISLDFVGPYLRGAINGCGWEGCMVMESLDTKWRVIDWSSDDPGTWCEPFGCGGMRGYWQRTVPEPVGLGLWLAMAAGVIARRKYL